MLKAQALIAVKENENTEHKPIATAANNPGQNPAADPEQTTAAAEQEKKSAALAALEPERTCRGPKKFCRTAYYILYVRINGMLRPENSS